jgi:hypothetical protein
MDIAFASVLQTSVPIHTARWMWSFFIRDIRIRVNVPVIEIRAIATRVITFYYFEVMLFVLFFENAV